MVGRVWAKGGRLAQLGYVDVSGGSVVHMAGGLAALVAAYMVGPRIGRYDAQGLPVRMPGHSIPLAVLGILLLWYGADRLGPGRTWCADVSHWRRIGMFGYTLAGVVGQLLLSADESEHIVRLGQLQWALGKAGFNMMLTGSTSFATAALLSLVRSRQRVSVLNSGMAFIAGKSVLP